MNIYSSDCQDFENNGKGFLTDIIEANVTEEINGTYQLYLEYILNGQNSEYLIEENIIKCNTGSRDNQLFRIKKVIKDFNIIKVYAFHIFYDLKDNFLDDVAPTNKTAKDFGNWILSKSNFENPFYVESTISTLKSARYVRRNVAECFVGDIDNSLVKVFNAEIDRDNFKIKVVNKIGNNNKIKLQIGKNITGIEILTDITNMFTRVFPVGFDGLMLPEKYIDSPLIGNYPTPKVAKIEFTEIKYDPEDESAYHDLNEAHQALRNSVQSFFESGGDKPSINVKIDWIELSKTEEYKNYSNLEKVKLGDKIFAEILGLEYETRIIKTIYNPLTNIIDSFELGSSKETLSTTISKFEKKADEINPNEILTQAKENATKLLTSALGGYVYKTQNELFIMDTNDPNTATKVWRWNLNGLGYSSSGIDGPYGIAITQDGQIVADFITTGKLNTNLIEGYENLVLTVKNFKDNSDKIAKIELELEKIQLAVSDSFDLTVSAKGENVIELSNVANSEPVLLRIYPTKEDISYLYPSDDLHPADDLFLPSRMVIFENTTTKKKIEYELPCDLLILDGIYDEFNFNSSARECKAIKRIGLNASGEKYTLDKPIVESFDYPNIELTEGNYIIYLLSFDFAYFECSAIAISPYSEQFVPRITYESGIRLTKEYIDEQVKLKLGTQEFESYRRQTATLISEMVKDEEFQSFRTQTSNGFSQTVKNGEIISAINQSAEQVKINANKINITANDILNLISNNTINLKSRNIVIQSDNFNVTANGTLTAKNVDIAGKITATDGSFTGTVKSNDGEIGNWDISTSGLSNGNFFVHSNGYSNIYTYADMVIIRNYQLNRISLTAEDIKHYDLNGDGSVDSADLLLMRQKILNIQK